MVGSACKSIPLFSEAIKFMFVADWSKIDENALLAALGQAFFTLSLGNDMYTNYPFVLYFWIFSCYLISFGVAKTPRVRKRLTIIAVSLSIL